MLSKIRRGQLELKILLYIELMFLKMCKKCQHGFKPFLKKIMKIKPFHKKIIKNISREKRNMLIK